MISASSDRLMAYGGWKHPPKILGTTLDMNMKFLPDAGIYKEAQNRKNNDITSLVCKLKTKISKNPIFDQNLENPTFGNETFRHADFLLQDSQYRYLKLSDRYLKD